MELLALTGRLASTLILTGRRSLEVIGVATTTTVDKLLTLPRGGVVEVS